MGGNVISKTDLAYTAGIIDGEGCISIVPRKLDGKVYHSLFVAVTCTDTVIVPWLKATFGGNTHQVKERRKNHRDMLQWGISTQEAEDFLRRILPWLRLKKPQAELALYFRTLKRDGYTVSKKTFDERDRCYRKLRAMHGRGR